VTRCEDRGVTLKWPFGRFLSRPRRPLFEKIEGLLAGL
jgi:hypothetical protein